MARGRLFASCVAMSVLALGCKRATPVDASDAAPRPEDAGRSVATLATRAAPADSSPPEKDAGGCAPATFVGSERCVGGTGCGFTIDRHGRRTFIRPIPVELRKPLRSVPIDSGGELTEHLDLVSDDDGPAHVTNDLDPGYPSALRDFGAQYRNWQYVGEWPNALSLVWDAPGGRSYAAAWTGESWTAPRPSTAPRSRALPKKERPTAKAAGDCGVLPALVRKDPLDVDQGYEPAATGIACRAVEVDGSWIMAACDDPSDPPRGVEHRFFLFHRGG